MGKLSMKTRRTLVALIFIAITCVGLAFHTGFGTFSQYGIGIIATLCPLGGLEAILASHSILPFGVLGIAIVVVLILIFGRAFCSWACPTSLVRRIFGLKSPYERRLKAKEKNNKDANADAAAKNAVQAEANANADAAAANAVQAEANAEADAAEAYAAADASADASADVAGNAASSAKDANAKAEATAANRKSDDAPAPHRGGLYDSRLWVLIGMLVATIVFGFPVFCLVCPVGLSFATVISVWRAIQFGEATWSLIVFPAILILEIVVFRRWCHTLCPLGALVSLISRGNRTFKATLDGSVCLKESKGIACDRCVDVCPEGIDMHPNTLSTPTYECLKCGECSQVCPVHAITFPFIPSKRAKGLVNSGTGSTSTATEDAGAIANSSQNVSRETFDDANASANAFAGVAANPAATANPADSNPAAGANAAADANSAGANAAADANPADANAAAGTGADALADAAAENDPIE